MSCNEVDLHICYMPFRWELRSDMTHPLEHSYFAGIESGSIPASRRIRDH